MHTNYQQNKLQKRAEANKLKYFLLIFMKNFPGIVILKGAQA
jgi:hypothetical protein